MVAVAWAAIALLAATLASLLAAFFHLGSRIDALGARLESRIDALGARLDSRIDSLAARLDAHTEAHAG
jgi:hypothetical protein